MRVNNGNNNNYTTKPLEGARALVDIEVYIT